MKFNTEIEIDDEHLEVLYDYHKGHRLDSEYFEILEKQDIEMEIMCGEYAYSLHEGRDSVQDLIRVVHKMFNEYDENVKAKLIAEAEAAEAKADVN